MRRRAPLTVLAACLSAAVGGAQAQGFGDAERGAAVWAQCQGCHMIGPDAQIRVGPPLNRIFGRRAASAPGFPYSRSMERAGRDGLIWTLVTLSAYVENPRALVSGTRMSYAGLKDAGARADLMAFLRDFSDQPGDIPEAEPTAVRSAPALSPEIIGLKGDPEYGAYLSSECRTCHQADGTDQGIPSITRWPEEDFVAAMHAYKQKLRPHPVMQMMAGRLSDAEIAALAAYFGTLEE